MLRSVVPGTLALLLTVAACGPQEEDPLIVPEEEARDAAALEGVLGGDPQLEGGCAWLEAGDERYEVVWPAGYGVEFDPLRLTGPDGAVLAAEGDPVRVSGREAPDMASICMVGPIFEADEVHTP